MIVFDLDRSINLLDEFINLFENNEYSLEVVYKNKKPYLRVGYNDVILDFSCWKYC